MIQKLESIFFLIVGLGLLLAAMIQKDFTSLLLGCCFLFISLIKREKKH